MKTLVVLAVVVAVGLTKSVSLLKSSEITEEMFTNPRYLVVERDTGLFEVEDLENSVADPVFLSEDDVTFYVYTPENRDGTFIRASQVRDIVRLTGFNLNRNTVVIVHGWRNHFQSPVNNEIRTALLANTNVNIIVVDWSGIADRNYINAQGSVLAVGNFIGDFLIRVNNELDHSLSRITLVGHSLGAHVSGNAGARALGLVGTIVGLDPAGPLFTANNINNRLDPTDANYVHVVHTNDGLLGFAQRMGHVDFYPNGGATQPGCGIDLAGSCAHARAYFYYAESINNDRFGSRQCGSFSQFRDSLCTSNAASNMGAFPVVRASVSGDYYLTTNDRALFARG